MIPEELAAIEARVDALDEHATRGEWSYGGDDNVTVFPGNSGQAELVVTVWGESGSAEEKALGEFIAHARTDVPALVAEVRRLRGMLSRIIGNDGWQL